MKKIVSISDIDAIEVRENNRLAPRYGMTQLSFQSLRVKELEVAHQCEEILKGKKFPLLLQKLSEFGFSADEQKEAQEFFCVLKKAKNLLKDGFHVLIIRSMLGCAGGKPSRLEYGAFDEKFTRALTDLEFRKDLWGTEYFLPIKLVSAVLLDLMDNIRLNDLSEENIRKSELVCSYLSLDPKQKDEKIEEFIKFCNA